MFYYRLCGTHACETLWDNAAQAHVARVAHMAGMAHMAQGALGLFQPHLPSVKLFPSNSLAQFLF